MVGRGLGILACRGVADCLLKRRFSGGRPGPGFEDSFGLDAPVGFDGTFGGSTLDVQFVAITKDFVAGDVESGAAAENDVVGAGRDARREKYEDGEGGGSRKGQAHSGNSGRAKRSIAAATPSLSLVWV